MHTNSTYEKTTKPVKQASETFKYVKARHVWQRTNKRLNVA